MITFTHQTTRFNYRVACVLLSGPRVLLHRADPDLFWTLPGGRCELLEDSAATVRREMQEELASPVVPERLLWVVENFFRYAELDYHELAFYWLAHLPDTSPLRALDAFEGREPTVRLHFRWFELASLPELDVRPAFLKDRLGSLPPTTEHLVVRERRAT